MSRFTASWKKVQTLKHGISPGRSRVERGNHTREREAEGFRDALSSTQAFPSGTLVKNRPANAGDADSIPWMKKVPWKRT